MNSRVNQPLALGLRGFLACVLRPLAHLRGFEVRGAERLPRDRRALILVANHVAFADSIYFMLAVRPRITICGAKPRFYSTAVRRALMTLANILRIDDRDQFLSDGGELLARGELLLVYPAMGRTTEAVGEFRPWAAELALANGVPLLPCYVSGTRGDGPVRIVVGHERAAEGEAATLTRALHADVCALRDSVAPGAPA